MPWFPESLFLGFLEAYALSHCSMYDNNNNRWKMDAVQQDFSVVDAAAILKITLPVFNKVDRQVWWPNKSGAFSVKSAYWLATCSQIELWQELLAGKVSDMWGIIWKIEGPPKLKKKIVGE